MSLEQELAQAKAKIAELELDVKLVTAGQAGRGVASATAAAVAAGKRPVLWSEFNRKMTPLQRMKLMTGPDRELIEVIDDRDV
jgi:hypothetical protein